MSQEKKTDITPQDENPENIPAEARNTAEYAATNENIAGNSAFAAGGAADESGAAENTVEGENTPAAEGACENVHPAEESTGENVQPAAHSPAQMQTAQPPKKKHRWVLNVLLIVVIALGLYSLFGISGEITQGEGMTFAEAMNSVSLSGALLLLAVIVGIMVVDCLKFCIVNKAVIGRVRPVVAIKTSFLGKFYDGVTPFSTGGQPMQIYYMTTKGVNVSDSSAVVLIRYFGSIFAFTVIGAVFMILGVSLGYIDNVGVGKTLLMVCGWVGLAVNLILPIFIAFFVFFPKLANTLTTWFINVGVKLRIVKNKEKVMAKALKIVDDFVTSFKIIVKKPVHLILFLICCFASDFLIFSVPFFVMNALSCDVHGMFFMIISLNVFATFGVSFIPTPGNSGVVEGMGVLAFNVAAGVALAWSVFFWRFSVYYIYILIGVVMTVIDLIVKNIKSKKTVKNE